MTYGEAVKFLYDLEGFGIKLGLDNVTRLLGRVGDPHLAFPAIHIAGTNGKGSTAAMLGSTLTAAGYKVGLYTSPHLVDFRERICIGGKKIPKARVVQYVEMIKPAVIELKCTFFESVTALGFLYFAEQGIDLAVVEVGMGGRLDATNVVKPLLTIITPIDYDHSEHLGRDLISIAREKGGIIKKGVELVTDGSQPQTADVLKEICRQVQAPFVDSSSTWDLGVPRFYRRFTSFYPKRSNTTPTPLRGFGKFPLVKLTLPGTHQMANVRLVLSACERLKFKHFNIKIDHIIEGLKKVRWPGRMQLVGENPLILLDVAHNPGGIKALRENLIQLFSYNKLILVFGVLKHKDYRGMIREMAPICDHVIPVEPQRKGALPSTELAREFSKCTLKVSPFKGVAKGFSYALGLASKDDLVCVTGSHFTVGEALQVIGIKCP
ncbi:bifunctional folylpolyglutamate synthase/dihydrofolate synthase [candidate division KSB1 bacterium]|nr:bifunctional folylpolyglutamate synthase/dihydrofolate synthase [candidate division KSB1 bacterium]